MTCLIKCMCCIVLMLFKKDLCFSLYMYIVLRIMIALIVPLSEIH